VTDALDKAAAALDNASDSAATAVDSAQAGTGKAADTVKADTARVADTVKAGTAKATDTVKAGTAKATDTVKAETAKATDTVKAETAKATDTVKAEATTIADKVDASASEAPVPPRSMDEIEAELQVTRDRLAGRIDDLADYVKPANVVERQKAKLKSVFVDEYGGIKPDRVLMAAGVVVALLGLGALRRRRRRA
jgi:hypothetical protein